MMTIITVVTDTKTAAGGVEDNAWCSYTLSGDDVEKIEAFIRKTILQSAEKEQK